MKNLIVAFFALFAVHAGASVNPEYVSTSLNKHFQGNATICKKPDQVEAIVTAALISKEKGQEVYEAFYNMNPAECVAAQVMGRVTAVASAFATNQYGEVWVVEIVVTGIAPHILAQPVTLYSYATREFIEGLPEAKYSE